MKILLTVILLFSISCGGGGGGGGDESQFAGVYTVRLVAVENSCSFSVAPETVVYTVNQVETRVVVDSSNGNVFEGISTGDDSFLVSRVGIGQCADVNGNIGTSTFQFTDTLEFILDDSRSPRVIFTSSSGNCSGNTFVDASCRYSMTGTATRDA